MTREVKRMRAVGKVGTGGARRLIAFGAIAIAMGFAWVSTTVAAPNPEFLLQFCESGSEAGQCRSPGGVATNPTTGHVYTAEIGGVGSRISEFTSWGEFVKAWGWGVRDGTAEFQVCTAATGCQGGISGDGAGQFSNPIGTAVDSSGNVYVVDRANARVQKFDSAGQFVLMFGGDVNRTKFEEGAPESEQNRCPVDPGDLCQAGTIGSGDGQFGAWPELSFIALSPGGSVYVGDENRIQEFDSQGAFQGQIMLPGAGQTRALAIDPSGDFYVVSQNIPGKVSRLDSSGAPKDFAAGPDAGTNTLTVAAPKALATGPSGTLYVVSGDSNPKIVGFKPSGVQLFDNLGEGDFANSLGVAANSEGTIYASNVPFSDSFIRAYGPEPGYEVPPSASPAVENQRTASAASTTAVVEAEISPNFWSTRYYVEYGLVDCEIGPCLQAPAAPGSLLPSKRGANNVTVALAGLLPGVRYHYRFVADSDGGATTFGADQTFTTHRVGAFILPDDRVYELVSPIQKNGGEAGVPSAAGGLPENAAPQQAAPTGEAVTYRSATAFGSGGEGSSIASQYLSRRGPGGWSTESISPRAEESFLNSPVVGVSRDLSLSAVIALESPLAAVRLDPDAPLGFWNPYRRDNSDGTLQTLTVDEPEFEGERYCVGYAGASAGFERMLVVAEAALISGDPTAVNGYNLYEWSEAEGLQLVSRLPDESPATPATGTGFGRGGNIVNSQPSCNMSQALLHNAISANGSRIFWTDASGNKLYARIDGSETIQLDAPEGGFGPGGEGEFRAASAGGSRVFFTEALNPLTPDAGFFGELYMYDFNAPQGDRLTPISAAPPLGAEVLGVLGASDEGDYVYFTAKGVLDGDAIAGEPNLYVWHDGEAPRFITTLSSGAPDNSNWTIEPSKQTARVSPDGGHLAFVSDKGLTGFDNTVGGSPGCVVQAEGGLAGSAQCAEVFLYDYENDDLICASCTPTDSQPLGPADLPTWSTPYEQPRYLLNGGRLFFESYDALALHDTNGKRDVYEWEREGIGSCSGSSSTFSKAAAGCISLISTGSSSDDSYFLDASVDGRDAFISTREGLVPWDQDGRFDVYDARIGGGLPGPATPSVCGGEACRPAQAPATQGTPSSATFSGPGNLVPRPRRCAKGKVRRKGHCVAKHRHNKRTKKHQASKKRRASR